MCCTVWLDVLVELVVLPGTLLVINFDYNTFGNILFVIVVTMIIKLIVNLYNYCWPCWCCPYYWFLFRSLQLKFLYFLFLVWTCWWELIFMSHSNAVSIFYLFLFFSMFPFWRLCIHIFNQQHDFSLSLSHIFVFGSSDFSAPYIYFLLIFTHGVIFLSLFIQHLEHILLFFFLGSPFVMDNLFCASLILYA